ncbi:AlpA family phage regulatory protein [Vibrio parahaemolyticus]|uniref:Transcriptional regulator n=1 Tax=Vibrio parahaemolyticus TaxID=670 RepID=A0AAW3IT35_VIBPH|nr:AlpA family phage regulatory protein [Vibrio parahaemolyticus]HDY7455636.1 AlpA family phage regulatory protein [Vibrio vulnificus]EIV8504033.1 AlpA family phage regulatory protein [Vibrio parahaemolyticus]EJG1017429.1 AlpA family phage regulatory protein [Vibrio parahaemolyticus]KON51393.1 transcriptional regulator [Vibrio parahaemolyticus]KOY25084.1 transcriptional regulator [Vibrio parahaemolyticus]
MKFLKLQQVMDKTTLCRSSIYNLIKAGDFPKNVTVMGKRKAWLESEVEDWMMSKMENTES